MADERTQQIVEIQKGYQPQVVNGGYKPQGQRGYQPQSNAPLDPLKLTPPQGGSAVQPTAQNGTPSKKE